MDEHTAKRLGLRIALLREQRGLSLADLEAATGTAKSYLSKLEKGDSLNVGLATLSTVAKALGLTVHDLLPRAESTDDSAVGSSSVSDVGASVPASPSHANEEVRFEMIADSMPEALRDFLNEERDLGTPVPEDAVRSLAVLKLRGRRPESKEDYRLLFQLLRRLTT